jgi:hypothetical protein
MNSGTNGMTGYLYDAAGNRAATDICLSRSSRCFEPPTVPLIVNRRASANVDLPLSLGPMRQIRPCGNFNLRPICAMCSTALPIIPSLASRSCCRGTSPNACHSQTRPPHRENGQSITTLEGRPPVPAAYRRVHRLWGNHPRRNVPIGCVAVAADEHNSLAMLVRHRGETLAQLLTRLDQAIAKALYDDVFTDEINPPR